MSDPIRDLAERLARVERELHALATAPRANRTSVQDGFTRWLTAEGTAPRIIIGASGTAGDVVLGVSGNNGVGRITISSFEDHADFALGNPDDSTATLRVLKGKMHTPLISCAWQVGTNVNIDAQGRPTNNTATYVELWQTVLPVTSGRVHGMIDVFPGVAGTFADAKIKASRFASGNPFVTVAETIGFTGTPGALIGPWDVPSSVLVPSASPIGHLVEFRVELRRTAGTGTVAVAARLPLINWV